MIENHTEVIILEVKRALREPVSISDVVYCVHEIERVHFRLSDIISGGRCGSGRVGVVKGSTGGFVRSGGLGSLEG